MERQALEYSLGKLSHYPRFLHENTPGPQKMARAQGGKKGLVALEPAYVKNLRFNSCRGGQIMRKQIFALLEYLPINSKSIRILRAQ